VRCEQEQMSARLSHGRGVVGSHRS
jgi:hypothetical protein